MYWERPIDIKRHNICTLQHVVGESCGTNQLAIVLALDSSVGAAPSVNNSLNCLVFVYIYLPCIHTILHINSELYISTQLRDSYLNTMQPEDVQITEMF